MTCTEMQCASAHGRCKLRVGRGNDIDDELIVPVGALLDGRAFHDDGSRHIDDDFGLARTGQAVTEGFHQPGRGPFRHDGKLEFDVGKIDQHPIWADKCRDFESNCALQADNKPGPLVLGLRRLGWSR